MLAKILTLTLFGCTIVSANFFQKVDTPELIDVEVETVPPEPEPLGAYLTDVLNGTVSRVNDGKTEEFVKESKRKLAELKEIIDEYEKKVDEDFVNLNDQYEAQHEILKKQLTPQAYAEHKQTFEMMHQIELSEVQKKFSSIKEKIDGIYEEIRVLDVSSFTVNCKHNDHDLKHVK